MKTVTSLLASIMVSLALLSCQPYSSVTQIPVVDGGVPPGATEMALADSLTCTDSVPLSELYGQESIRSVSFVQARFVDQETIELVGWSDQSQEPYMPQTWRVRLDGSKAEHFPYPHLTPLANPCQEQCDIHVFSESNDKSWQVAHVVSADAQTDGLWLIGSKQQFKLLNRLDVVSVEWLWAEDSSLLWLARPLPYGDRTDVVIVRLNVPPQVYVNPMVDEPVDPTSTQILLSPPDNLVLSFRRTISGTPATQETPRLDYFGLRDGQPRLVRSEIVAGLERIGWDVTGQRPLIGVTAHGACFISTMDRSLSAQLPTEECSRLFHASLLAHPFTASPGWKHLIAIDGYEVRVYNCRQR